MNGEQQTAVRARLPGTLPDERGRRRAPRQGDEGLIATPRDTTTASVIDIVICIHDALSDVQACLASVVRNTEPSTDLIIVDDASDVACQEYLKRFADSHGRCALFRNEERLGYTRSANCGLECSAADYVVLLNSDTIVTPHWIERLLECAASDPAIGIVGPLSNAASWQSVPDVFEPTGDWSTNPLPPNWSPDRLAELAAKVSSRRFPRVPFVNGFCLLVRRAVIDEIGLFDEVGFPDGYGEENDYCLRAAEAGFQLAIADHAYVYHAKSRSYSDERRRELSRSGHRVLRQRHRSKKIDAGVARLEADPTLAEIRQQIAQALRNEATTTEPIWGSRFGVLFVMPAPGGAGGTHSIVQEASGMRQLGVHAQVAVDAKFHTTFMETYQSYADMHGLFSFYSSPQELVVRAAEFDVIVGSVYSSMSLVKLITDVFPSKLAAYYVQDYEPYFFEPGTSRWEAARASYSLVPDAVLFGKTLWIGDTVRREHGVDVHKVQPSIDHDVYYPAFASDRPTGSVVSIGAMIRPSTPRRAPQGTMRVLKRLKQSLEDRVDIHVFGSSDGVLEGSSLDFAFEFTNHGILSRSAVADLLRASDIFLDLSDYQAFGRTALEAMACGCAVVVPAAGGATEYAVDGENALVVDTADEEACFDAAQELIANAEMRCRLRAAALRKATEYSIRRAAISELLLFGEALRSRASPSPPATTTRRHVQQERKRTKQVVEQVTPPDATVLFVTDDDARLPKLDGRRAWSFPHDEDGAAAIARLEALREQGADHLAFPRPAFRCLERDAEFRRHLETRYRAVALEPDAGLVFALGQPPTVDGALDAQRRALPYPVLVQSIRAIVEQALPADATVLVVNKGDYELLDLGDRRGWHFPQGADGGYAGYHPADSAAAIAHLEELRARGADYLLFPSTAFWWLDHYAEFRRHLETRYRPLPLATDACRIFALGGASATNAESDPPLPTVPEVSTAWRKETMVAEIERVGLPESAMAGLDSGMAGVVVRGWVHATGNSCRLDALLYLDDVYVGSAPAVLYRADLARQGMSDGWCGFEFALPPEVIDDKEHVLSVRLEPDGKVLASRKIKIAPSDKPYTDVDDFFDWSYFHRMSLAPFSEADKRVLSYFDWKRRHLAARFAAREEAELPLISVIMPTYNRAAVFEHAIASVLAQSYRNLELIVVDDGSTDATVDIIRTFHDDRVKLFVLNQNGGVSNARNVGLEHASGDLIAYLDSDNWWDDDHLAVMFEAISADRDFDAAYCGQFLYKTGSSLPFAFRAGPFNRQLLDNRNYIDLNCYLHRRSLYEKLGGFDTDLRKLVDWDLVLRYSADRAPLFVEVVTSHYVYNTDQVTLTQSAATLDFAKDVLCKGASDVLTLDLQALGVGSTSPDHAVVELPVPKAPAIARRKAGTSIVIPSYNIPGVLTACVERLVDSLGHRPYEIIVVDNGSEPEHLPRIEALSRRFSRVTTTYLRANLGFTEAVNVGISMANPEWDVVLHNNDAIVTPGWLDAMREALDAVPDAGLVGPRQLLLPHDRTIRTHSPFAATDRIADVNVSVHHKNYRRVLDKEGFFVEVGFVPFFCVLIRRDVIRAVGSLDTALGRHYRSDRNYCNVVREHVGRRIVVALRAKVYHLLQRSTEDLRTRDKERFADLYVRNRIETNGHTPFWV